MLLRLYYFYEKSPKKCRELNNVVSELKQRWITHKLSAMKRVAAKFGVYTHHPTSLSQYSAIKPADRAKLRGYLNIVGRCKMPFGLCIFHRPAAPMLHLFEGAPGWWSGCPGGIFTPSAKELERLILKIRVLAYILRHLACAELWGNSTSVNRSSPCDHSHRTLFDHYCSSVTDCLKTRLAWSDLQLVRDVVMVLETQGWQKIVDDHPISK